MNTSKDYFKHAQRRKRRFDLLHIFDETFDEKVEGGKPQRVWVIVTVMQSFVLFYVVLRSCGLNFYGVINLERRRTRPVPVKLALHAL